MRKGYRAIHDGGLITLGRGRDYLVRCCDCGLVHYVRYKISRAGHLSMRVWRQKRATATSRRRRDYVAKVSA